MKKQMLLVSGLALLNCEMSQGAVVFSETIGTVSATTAIATHETNGGFDNDSFTYSGTGDLRVSTPSTGYAGASGSSNVFLTSNSSRTFQIDGISTTGYTSGTVGISFGAHKSTTASNMATLILEYSTTGSSWTAISIPTQPTGSGTAIWRSISIPTTTIPISSTLSLRWTNSDTGAQYRLDDIALTADPIPEPASALLGAFGFLGILRRRR